MTPKSTIHAKQLIPIAGQKTTSVAWKCTYSSSSSSSSSSSFWAVKVWKTLGCLLHAEVWQYICMMLNYVLCTFFLYLYWTYCLCSMYIFSCYLYLYWTSIQFVFQLLSSESVKIGLFAWRAYQCSVNSEYLFSLLFGFVCV